MLVPADDLDAAIETVAGLLADPLRRGQMAHCGRQTAVECYSHAVVGRQYARILPD
jgi:glycosyltransferase involved in cell wall biosynthesis